MVIFHIFPISECINCLFQVEARVLNNTVHFQDHCSFIKLFMRFSLQAPRLSSASRQTTLLDFRINKVISFYFSNWWDNLSQTFCTYWTQIRKLKRQVWCWSVSLKVVRRYWWRASHRWTITFETAVKSEAGCGWPYICSMLTLSIK